MTFCLYTSIRPVWCPDGALQTLFDSANLKIQQNDLILRVGKEQEMVLPKSQNLVFTKTFTKIKSGSHKIWPPDFYVVSNLMVLNFFMCFPGSAPHCAVDPLIGEDSLLGCSLPSGSASCLDDFAPVLGGSSQIIPGTTNHFFSAGIYSLCDLLRHVKNFRM